MKKIFITVGVLAGLFANAQIKVQSNISNSISKQNPFLDASNYSKGFDNNIGKGLYFPSTDLRTWEFKTDLVNPGNFSTYFDGMIVYNTGEGEPTTEANKGGIRKNLTRGFYYFKNPNQTFPGGSIANGEWVRISDAQANAQLWAQRDNNGVTETYLVPADANGDYVGYANGSFFKNLTSSSFDLNNTTSEWWGFNDANYFVDANHINNANNTKNEVRYQAQFRGLYTDNSATRDIRSMIGGTNVATIGDTRNGSTAGTPLTSVNVGSVLGFQSRVDNYTSGTVGTATGNSVVNSNYGGGHVDKMYGIDVLTRSYGSATNSSGLRSRNYLFENATADLIYGGSFGLVAQSGSVVNQSIQGLRNDVTLDNATVNTTFNHGIRNIFTLKTGSTIGRFEGVNTTFYGESGTTIGDYAGYRLLIPSDNKANVTNMYGLYLDGIDKGTDKNYSIYTNAGAIRFGDLAGSGERVVVADADGKLKTESINNIMSANGEWRDATLTRILSDGTQEDYGVIYANQAKGDGNDVVVSDDGYLGIGTDNPWADLTISGKPGDNAEISLTRYADNGNGANLTLSKAYGTPDAPQTPPVGSSLARFRSAGYTGGGDGSNHQTKSGWDGFASNIETLVAGVPNINGTLPTNMFLTVTNDQGQRNILLKLQGNSGVGVGFATTEDIKARLQVNDWNDVTLTSTKNAFMIGRETGHNLVMDANEIMARNNGTNSGLSLQAQGGDIFINGDDTDVTKRFYFRSSTGNVGMGVANPTEKLEIAGAVKAESFKGSNGATIFPDYVFENYYTGTSTTKAEYNFKNLNQVESFVKINGHLPGYQSAKEVKAQGYIDIMKTQLTNVEKIEELYLHTIEQEKAIQAKEAKIAELEAELATQKERLDKLEKLLVQ